MPSSDEEQKDKFLFCKGSNSYKYADSNIREDELHSHGINKIVDIEKTKAIDLLTEKFDFEKLELCQNSNLHYLGESFLVKIDYFSAYIVKGKCQKRKAFLNVQSMQVSNKLWEIFTVNNRKINHGSAELNWICSNGLLAINAGWLPLYKKTYFKDAIVLFDGICEMNCKGLKKYYIDVKVFKRKNLLPENYWSF